MNEVAEYDLGHKSTKGKSLFELLGPEGFKDYISSLGKVLETESGDEQILEVTLPKGTYSAAVGFPRIDPQDKRYFYNNLPTQLQERALKLDLESPSFAETNRQFKSLNKGNGDFINTMVTLQEIVKSNLEGSTSDEDVISLSDILTKQNTVCAGMVLVGGLLAKVNKPDFEVNRVVGSPLQFDKVNPLNYSHEWLRISDEKKVALLDPLYGHLSIYDLQRPETSDEDPFSKYQIFATGPGFFVQSVHEPSSPNLKLVTRPNESGFEFWVKPELALGYQIQGKLPFATKTEGVEITMVDGSLEISRNPQNKQSGRILIPLIELSKS